MDADEDDDIDNDTEEQEIEITSYGVNYPCMKNRKSMGFDKFYARYNKFKRVYIDNYHKKKDNKSKEKSSPKSLNDRLLSTCFICDIYIVSNLSLRRRYLGYTAIIPEISLQLNEIDKMSPTKSTAHHSGLRYCILEKLGRAGIKGLLQTDLVNELNTTSKNLFTAIKHLQNMGLIIIEEDMMISNCNHIWLSSYQFRSNIRTLSVTSNFNQDNTENVCCMS